MDKATVSVIIPVYKVEKYIRKCVDSILAQTYKNIEIILVDDGSPDNCPDICDLYAEKHDNVRVLHKPNGGLSSARNYGVIHANSNWIIFVDSDDYVSPTYIQDLITLREQFSADMAITRIVRCDENGKPLLPPHPFSSYCTDAKKALIEVYMGRRVGWEAYGKVYSKQSLLKYPFPDGYYEDCAVMYRMIMDADRIAIGCFEENYYYITRTGSILNNRLSEKHLRIFTICDEFAEFVDSLDNDMQFLKSVMYQRAVIQMLNLQEMRREQYTAVFKRYRKDFRSSLLLIMTNPDCSWKTKTYRLFLCSTPSLYKIFTTFVHRT